MKSSILLEGKTVLVTGSPGFIGANLVLRLLKDMTSGVIVSLDNMNDYYDPKLKEYRLSLIEDAAKSSPVKHVFVKANLADKTAVDKVFADFKPDIVVNLAAQAGVRYSIDHPEVYIQSNLIGFYNILEACRNSYSVSDVSAADHENQGSAVTDIEKAYKGVQHLVYASSSSVYGGNKKVPFSTDDKVDNPVSLYAATKKSDELLAHAYSKLYNIPSTGLRFFTVYGPAGRPDMFYYTATDKLVRGETIKIFNYGNMKRDFTYIDDIIEGIIRVMQGAPEKMAGEDGLPVPPYALYNIGGGQPENLLDFVNVLQEELVRAEVLPSDYDFEAHRELVGMQPGDVPVTYADSTALEADYGFTPKIGIREGLRKFAEWYKDYQSLT
ncbi:MAG: GDP-mannose 4,6-dehydratase [Lachnospiraceae bacterium]|nr:GDP-mannose 4,6-dehydratase [Lachnospiraceae bacterium]